MKMISFMLLSMALLASLVTIARADIIDLGNGTFQDNETGSLLRPIEDYENTSARGEPGIKLNDSGYRLGSGKKAVRWFIANQTGLEADIDFDIEWNDTTLTLTPSLTTELKRSLDSEYKKSGRSIKDVPVSKTSIQDTRFQIEKESIDLESEEPIIIRYDSLEENMTFKIGINSVTITTTSSTIATAYESNENICISPDGTYHVSWVDSADDVWYADSTDEGITWQTEEVLDATSADQTSITCAPNGDLVISYIQGFDLLMVKNTGSGWPTSPTVVEDDIGALVLFGNVATSDSVVHWCMVDGADDLHYVNSDNLDGADEISWLNTDQCDIAADSNDNLYVILTENGADYIEIMSSVDSWGSRNELIDLGVISNAPNLGVSIAIQDNGTIHATSSTSSASYYCSGSTANWDDASAWNCDSLSSTGDKALDVAVSELGDVFILGSSSQGDSGTIYVHKKVGGGSLQVDEQIHTSAGEPSIADSLNSRMSYVLPYVYTSADEDVLFDTYPLPAPSDSCTYSSGDWAIDCSDNCQITEDVDLNGNSLIAVGSGTLDVFSTIHNADYVVQHGTCLMTCRNSGGCFG